MGKAENDDESDSIDENKYSQHATPLKAKTMEKMIKSAKKSKMAI